MFEVKPRAVEKKKESSTETDEGLGSSGRHHTSGSLGSCSAGSGSLYLSDSQDWVVSPSCSPDEGPTQINSISPLLAEETLRYMKRNSRDQSHETGSNQGESLGRRCQGGQMEDEGRAVEKRDGMPGLNINNDEVYDTFAVEAYLALEPSSYSRPGSQSLSKVLSADRVEQMTKTYNDIEVVSHLLAERDRDLELAARIGQSLLQRNQLLQERNDAVEEQLAQAVDQVHQLQHELTKKDELLRIVAIASEEGEQDSNATTPQNQLQLLGGAAATALVQLEHLQDKLQELEEENQALRSEAYQLKRDTVTYEEKEQQLVSDCVQELRESNSQMVSLTDELSQKNEELLRHQEEIAQLLSQIVELQHRVKELALEKEELKIHLQASKDAQRQLTAELNELAERNAECVEMLHESQEEIKELRSKSSPSTGMRRHLSYGLYPMESLAAEIEGSMRRELSIEEETASQDQRISQKRVFQTVRSVNASASRAAMASPPIPGSGQSSLVMTAQPFQSAQGDEVRMGQPGLPGGNDLTKALHRLSLRRQNFLSERQFFQVEREKKLQTLSGADGEGSGCSSPMGSVLSSFSNLSDLTVSSTVFKTFLPEKLQIVKPMEGSLTLHHWQQLAKPHLATILDPHPGVVTKGFRPLAQDAVFQLADMEEDEEGEEHRGIPVLEKGTTEKGKEELDEEEEEGGITFNVRCSSTPEERNHSVAPHTNAPLPSSRLTSSGVPSTSSCVHSDLCLTLNEVTGKLNQSPHLIPGASTSAVQSQSRTSTSTSSSFVPNPGKSQSSTFSTYTFTTCRILHPTDVTLVTPSSQSSLSANTPSSMRTGPSTPVTPCRLSLGDSFPHQRPPAPPSSLAKLVLERGISAQVSTDAPSSSSRCAPRQPLLQLVASTPANSPSQSPVHSPVPTESRQHPPDNFLASRPAELFLQDVYGLNLGRAPHPDLPSPSQETTTLSSGSKPVRDKANLVSVGLVERLRHLGFSKVLHSSESDAPVPHQEAATFVSAGGGSLMEGLRRNQSLPAMIGARVGTKSTAHPTSLAIPPSPWGNLKERRPHLASISHPQRGSKH